MQKLNAFYAEKKTRKLLLGVLFACAMLPNLSFGTIRVGLIATIPLSFTYFFSLVFAPWLLCHVRRWRLPPWPVTGLFAFVILYALAAGVRFGISRTLLNWVFGAYLLLVCVNLGADFAWEDWQDVLKYPMLLFAVLEAGNVALQSRELLGMAGRVASGEIAYYRPEFRSLTRGGVNLDASWMGLGCFFMARRGEKYAYWLWAALFAGLYSSRTGIVACGVYLVWAVCTDRDWRPNRKTVWIFAGAAAAELAVLYVSGALSLIVDRFLGKVNGGDVLAGRGAMWSNVWRMFRDNPFGCGVGNAMIVMSRDYGFKSYEDNLHNVFFQFVLDEGFLGALWYAALVAGFLRRELRARLRHPLAGYFCCWLVLSLVEFHGGEVQMQFVLGAYLACRMLVRAPAPGQPAEPQPGLWTGFLPRGRVKKTATRNEAAAEKTPDGAGAAAGKAAVEAAESGRTAAGNAADEAGGANTAAEAADSEKTAAGGARETEAQRAPEQPG